MQNCSTYVYWLKIVLVNIGKGGEKNSFNTIEFDGYALPTVRHQTEVHLSNDIAEMVFNEGVSRLEQIEIDDSIVIVLGWGACLCM